MIVARLPPPPPPPPPLHPKLPTLSSYSNFLFKTFNIYDSSTVYESPWHSKWYSCQVPPPPPHPYSTPNSTLYHRTVTSSSKPSTYRTPVYESQGDENSLGSSYSSSVRNHSTASDNGELTRSPYQAKRTSSGKVRYEPVYLREILNSDLGYPTSTPVSTVGALDCITFESIWKNTFFSTIRPRLYQRWMANTAVICHKLEVWFDTMKTRNR